MTLSLIEKIEAAQKKLQQLKERQRALEARERATRTKAQRADDTRRKILAGAIVLGTEDRLRQQVMLLLNEKLIRDDDRKLFGFGPLPQPVLPIAQSLQSAETAGPFIDYRSDLHKPEIIVQATSL